MSSEDPRLALCGRASESATLDDLLAAVLSGESRVLVLRGEAGVGKTALLDYLVARGQGCRIARAAGVESEMELAYAGLQQLCAPFLDRLSRLPAPQRDALGTALGLNWGSTPDRFLVGLAVLNLLAEVAEDQPLLCVIDDLQWMDQVSAQTLAFVAHRLLAERLGLIFAVRDVGTDRGLPGLPQLAVDGLSTADARTLLAATIHGPMDDGVQRRIVAESRGNPLALLELPRELGPADLAGGFGRPDAPPVTTRIEQSFLGRIESLAPTTRQLLLTAAAEPLGDLDLLWRATTLLEIDVEAAIAEASGIADFGLTVRFRHPLVRSTVYRAASSTDRQRTHQALADATDARLDPDRRAWHRAHATTGLDEEVAADLERSAARAQRRGGLAAAAAFLERATALTPEPAQRAGRALAAAQSALEAGAPDAALRLLAVADSGPLTEREAARAELLRAQVTAASRGSNAPPLLLNAARRLEPIDVALARTTYRDALSSALFAGRFGDGPGLTEMAAAVHRAPPPPHPPQKSDQLLDGRAVLFTDGLRAAHPMLQPALEAFCADENPEPHGLSWLWLASITAADLWDHESWSVLSARYVKSAREAGALGQLPLALSSLIFVHLSAGELVEAASLVDEVRSVTEATGATFPPYGALGLAAWQGREARVSELVDAAMSGVVPRGEGLGVTMTHWTNAILLNGVGRYAEALTAAQQSSENPQELGASSWALSELVEAAVRSGQSGIAENAVERLAMITQGSGTDWALGVEARSRALLSEGEAAESLYHEAIERLARTRVRFELGRSQLIYGEWLRRQNRRLDAREQLRAAHEWFLATGVGGFAERSRRELLATGETVRKRSVSTRDDLTAQEAQIARLAAQGRTNPEIGAELFISARTVEWHLRKVFPKLDITSRRELSAALSDA